MSCFDFHRYTIKKTLSFRKGEVAFNFVAFNLVRRSHLANSSRSQSHNEIQCQKSVRRCTNAGTSSVTKQRKTTDCQRRMPNVCLTASGHRCLAVSEVTERCLIVHNALAADRNTSSPSDWTFLKMPKAKFRKWFRTKTLV